jgi:hypothetical protein
MYMVFDKELNQVWDYRSTREDAEAEAARKNTQAIGVRYIVMEAND